MTRRVAGATQVAVEQADLGVPTYRYWGSQKPPKDRAEFFNVETTDAAGDPDPAGTVGTIRLYGPIDSWGGWWGVSAKDVSTALDSFGEGVTHIVLRVNSPGGEVFEGLAILNMLRAHGAKVTAVVDGIAASAASFIAAGCDETVMSPGTQMMIHDARNFAYGPPALFRKVAGILDSISDSVAELYAEATGSGTAAEWRALMTEETWYSASEAVTAGLADRTAVVPDVGHTETSGDDPEPEAGEDDFENRFDLSLFDHPGRANAPAPARVAARAHQLPAASAGGQTETEGRGSEMPDILSDEQITGLRQQLGVSEDADGATIMGALSEALNERATDAANVPEGMTLIEQDVLAQLRAGAEAGIEARNEQRTQARDNTIDAAVRDGRITPARTEHWRTSWDADPEGTAATLAGLPKGLVPVTPIGHDGDPENTAADDVYDQLFGKVG